MIFLTDCSLACSDPDVPCLPVVKEDKIAEQGSEYYGFSASGEVSKPDVIDVASAEVLLVVLDISSILRQVKTCAADSKDVSSLTSALNHSSLSPLQQTTSQRPPPWPPPDLCLEV